MPNVVVFAFAIADGLKPVVGAAPYDVLARQIPRTLVAQVNDADDRGLRFFPFIGPVDGQRSFLKLNHLLAPKALLELHKQGDVGLLVDGMLHADRLEWRVVNGSTGDGVLAIEVPFSARDPLAVLPRLAFELTGLLGVNAPPCRVPELSGPALGWFLVLQDELLRHEAKLPSNPEPLRSACQCVELAGEDCDVQQLVLDFLALLLRRGEHRGEVLSLAERLAPKLQRAAAIDRLGGLMFAAGGEEQAVKMVVRAALLAPHETELVERATSMAFRSGDDASVAAVVQAARDAGASTATMIAHLAASCDRVGDVARRQELVSELVGQEDLPVPVARLIVSFLLEEEQPALARTVIEAALQKAPDQAMLHYELGRACLLLNKTARASVALQRAIDIGLPDHVLDQGKRLLRLSLVPGLWLGTHLVEKAIMANDLGAALGAVRTLVRRVGPVAEAWLMFGIVQQKLGRLQRAERLLRRAVRYHENCAEAHNRLGIVLLQRGAVKEGGEHLAQAHMLSPHDTSTLLHLAQATALSGQIDVAEQHIQQAEKLGADPQLVQAVRNEIRAA